MSPAPEESTTRVSVASLEQIRPRLEHLYEIGKLYATFENVEQTFDPALGLVAKTLPLRSAILIETEDGRSRMTVWPSKGEHPEHLRIAVERATAGYAYLIGASSTGSLDLTERAGATPLPEQPEAAGEPERRFILIPLVVADHALFGALQLEAAQPVDKSDLMFVNAIANQLAIALDRDRTRRRELVRREHAEALAAENARLYDQAQQAVRGREHILAIVSHDLRTPLGIMMMTADVLSRGKPHDELTRRELDEAGGRIRRSAARMLRLIEDLLDFASIEVGNLAITSQPCAPGSMIDEILASFDVVAQQKKQRLTAQVAPDLPEVHCDRDRILQVLSNLVANASKATPEGGVITLRAERRGDEVLFVVSDNGPGISEADLPHLFERYWRSGEAQYKGSGLGLAIASGIVGAHGGKIWVESALGRGASFLFTVPVGGAATLTPAGHPS
jgi:signal transduction histidine kinase